MAKVEGNRPAEIDSLRQINELKQGLERALISGAKSGDLSQARQLQEQIQDRLDHVRENLLNPSYPVAVDYDRTIEELITAGKFNWVGRDITSINFRDTSSGRADLNIYLLKYNRMTATEAIIDFMTKYSFRPVTLKELLCLSIQYPQLQRRNYIVSLGDTYTDPDNDLYVPYLNTGANNRGRGIRLILSGGDWAHDFRFAAVVDNPIAI